MGREPLGGHIPLLELIVALIGAVLTFAFISAVIRMDRNTHLMLFEPQKVSNPTARRAIR